MSQADFATRYIALQKILVQARREMKLTQSAVAQILGKPQSFVSKYERGERRLDLIEFIAVAEVLRLDPGKVIRELSVTGAD